MNNKVTNNLLKPNRNSNYIITVFSYLNKKVLA